MGGCLGFDDDDEGLVMITRTESFNLLLKSLHPFELELEVS